MLLLGKLWRGVSRGAAVLAACVALAGPASESKAQFGMDFGGLMNQDPLTKRGLQGYAKLLELDKEQLEAATVLMDGTTSAHRAAMKQFQEKMQEMQAKAQEDGDWSVFQKEMPAIAEELQTKTHGLETQFFADLKALCSEKQLAAWDRVERYRRRETGMRYQLVSGSAVDLIAITERSKLNPGTREFDDAILAYEEAIDRPLVALQKYQDEQNKNQKEAMKKLQENPMGYMEEIKKMLNEAADIAKTMRTVNREHARRMSDLLPESSRGVFAAEINRKFFPRIYRDAYAGKVLNAALKMTDLTSDQKRELEALKASYEQDKSPLDDKWAKAQEEYEDKNGGTVGIMMTSWQGGGEGKEAVTEARQARRDLDSKTVDAAKAILSEAQRGNLPEKKPDPMGQFADFMPDPDEVGEGLDVGTP